MLKPKVSLAGVNDAIAGPLPSALRGSTLWLSAPICATTVPRLVLPFGCQRIVPTLPWLWYAASCRTTTGFALSAKRQNADNTSSPVGAISPLWSSTWPGYTKLVEKPNSCPSSTRFGSWLFSEKLCQKPASSTFISGASRSSSDAIDRLPSYKPSRGPAAVAIKVNPTSRYAFGAMSAGTGAAGATCHGPATLSSETRSAPIPVLRIRKVARS